MLRFVAPHPPQGLQAIQHTHILLAPRKQCNIFLFPISVSPRGTSWVAAQLAGSQEGLSSISKSQKNSNLNGELKLFAQNPYWPGLCDSADVLSLKLRCNKLSACIERPIPPSLNRTPHLETSICLGQNKNLGHGPRGDWIQGWLLAKASNSLTDCPSS
jgi:hypothetical protein